jgi:putative hydrolase of the HAD superfamily
MLFIFDMGGVITGNVAAAPKIARLCGITVEEFFRFAPENAFDDLQDGKLSLDAFWQSFTDASGIQVPGDLWRFCFMPQKFPQMYTLLARLRERKHRVVCGTNTIPCHYEVHNERGDYACFDKVYASHLMKLIKPDPRFWQFILTMEEEVPENVFFIDDNKDNVLAAEKLGIRSHLFTSPDAAEEVLKQWL